MAKILKKNTFEKDLEILPVYINDTDPNSTFFKVKNIPNEFPRGKSYFLILGSDRLKNGSRVDIEIKDSEGNVVYHEIPYYLEATGRAVSVYVYSDTAEGEGTLTITGEAKNVPTSWKGEQNVRWKTNILINPDKENLNPIRLTRQPSLIVNETFKNYLDYEGGSSFTLQSYITGNVKGGPAINEELYDDVLTYDPSTTTSTQGDPKVPIYNAAKESNPDDLPENIDYSSMYEIVLDGGSWPTDSVSGLLTVPSSSIVLKGGANDEYDLENYEANVYAIINSSTILVTPKYKLTKIESDVYEQVEFSLSPYTLQYYEEATSNEISHHSESIARIDLRQLETFSGKIASANVYKKSLTSYTEWELLGNYDFNPRELLQTEDRTNPERTGKFKELADINQYWNTRTTSNPTATPSVAFDDDEYLYQSAKVSEPNSKPFVFNHMTGSHFELPRNHEFTLRAEIAVKISEIDPEGLDPAKMEIYLSGSAFGQDQGDKYNLGKKVATLKSEEDYHYIEKEFNFITETDGTVIPSFYIHHGEWYIANVSIKPAADKGFNAQLQTLYVPSKSTRRTDYLKFKIELLDKNGNKSDYVLYSPPTLFVGSPLIIEETDNVLNGSLYLSNTTESGIELSGVSSGYIRSIGYEGFESASLYGHSGFMMWSGSVLPESSDAYIGVGLELHAGYGSGSLQFRAGSGSEAYLRISGSLYATDGYFDGIVSASTGYIGGWIIGDTFLSSSETILSSSGEIYSPSFSIDPEGNVTASDMLMTGGRITGDVTIEGSLTADSIGAGTGGSPGGYAAEINNDGYAYFESGSIGSFVIGEDALYSDNFFISGSSTGNEYFISASKFNVKANGDMTASQVLINGGKITGDVTIEGSLTADSIGAGTGSSPGGYKAEINNEGYAYFSSGTIAGFTIYSASGGDPDEIKSLNNNIRLKENGQITASSMLLITGEVTASRVVVDTGSISGWQLNPGYLVDDGNNIRLDPDGPYVISSSNFQVNTKGGLTASDAIISGSLYAIDGNFSGVISASVGNIGGWTIESGKLVANSNNMMLSGSGVISSSNFYVSEQGNVTASDMLLTDGTITGSTITTHSGSISGWILEPGHLVDENDKFRLTPEGLYVISSSNFWVDIDGNMTSSNAQFSGSIYASSGFFEGTLSSSNAHIGGFAIEADSIHDSGDNLILRSNGQITGSKVLFTGGRITGDVTIEGTVTADSVGAGTGNSPGGFASEIDSNGYAYFESGNIGGWTIDSQSLTSANDNLMLSGSGVISSSNFYIDESGNVTASNVNLSGSIFANEGMFSGSIYASSGFFDGTLSSSDAYIGGFVIDSETIHSSNKNLILSSSGQLTASDALITGTINASDGTIGGFNISDDALSGTGFYISGSATGNEYFISSSIFNVKANGNVTGSSVLFTGGKIGGFELTSTQLNSGNDDLILKSDGQITGSNVYFEGGTIGGFQIQESLIRDFTNDLVLRDNGQITGSNVLFDGGTIAGWTIDSNQIYSTNIWLNSSTQTIAIKDTTFGNDGIQLQYDSDAKIYIGDGNDKYFQYDGTNITWKATNTELNSSGNLIANNVNLSGSISASSGHFTGEIIAQSGQFTGEVNAGTVSFGLFDTDSKGMKINANNYFILDNTTPKFSVGGADGIVYDGTDIVIGTDVQIEGAITASTGFIGGWEIGDTFISASDTILSSSGEIYTPNFQVDPSGNVTANNVNLSGSIYATDGTFSGSLYAENGFFNGTLSSSDAYIGGFAIEADSIHDNDDNLILKSNGQLTASEALITGTINADDGTIGGFNINDNSIYDTGLNLILSSSGQITGSQVLFDGGTIAGWTFDNTALWANGSKEYSDYTTGGITIHAGGSIHAQNFYIDPTGYIFARGAELSGSISASSGYFAGEILAGTVKFGLFDTDEYGMKINSDNYFVLDGGTPKFRAGGTTGIDYDGSLFKIGTNVQISGSISASEGYIGGWKIEPTYLSSSNIIIDSSGTIQTSNFTSDLRGWKIDGFGNAEFENAKIRGSLKSTVFEKESINVVGGQLWVANSTALSESVTSGDTSFLVENSSGFVENEILMIKKSDDSSLNVEYVLINSISSDTLNVTRAYENGTTVTWAGYSGSTASDYEAGQVLVSTGVTGSGFIKINAYPNNLETPFIDIVERTGSGINDLELRARLGDLSGLSPTLLFGDTDPDAGLYTPNAYLTGKVVANSGSIGGWEIRSDRIVAQTDKLSLFGTGIISASNFYVDSLGNMTASNVEVEGTISSSDAWIGGFSIDSNSIRDDGNNLILKSDGQITASNALISGSIYATTGLFSGSIYAENGFFNGTLSSSDAYIGGFAIDANSIQDSDGDLILRSSGQITGSEVLFTGGKIGGWNIDSTNLYGTNIWLNSTTQNIAIKNTTFGSQGIQLQYDNPNANMYVGNGTDEYLQFQAGTLTWKATNTELDSSGNLIANNVKLTGSIFAEDGIFSGSIYAEDGYFTGSIYATDGVFSGSIYAQDGFFDGEIKAGDVSFGIFDTDSRGMKIDSNNYFIDDGGTPKFMAGGTNGIVYDGTDIKLGTDVQISGSISASDGTIGGWQIGANELTAIDGNMVLSGSGAISSSTFYAGDPPNVTGPNNTLLGYQSGWSLTSAQGNFTAGYQALYSSQTSSYNIAIGYQSLYNEVGGPGLGFGYNIAIGHQSMYTNTEGYINTAIGYQALYNNTIGTNNIAIGPSAMLNNISGLTNVAMGYQALKDNTEGNSNVAIGNDAMRDNSVGDLNVAIGSTAMKFATSGSQNVAIGGSVLSNNTTGDDNIAIGYDALTNNLTGDYNVALGASANALNRSGSYNIALGNQAVWGSHGASYNVGIGNDSLYNVSTGIYNVGIGTAALRNITSGSGNIGIGYLTLRENDGSDYNVGIGYQSLRYNETGISNVGIGYQSLYNNISGSNNISMGYKSLYNNIGADNNTAIGPNSLYVNTTGQNNIAFGVSASYANIDGDNNIAIGHSSLINSDYGYNNIAIGPRSLLSNGSGYNNVALGVSASANNTTGFDNVAIGNNAVMGNTTGDYNIGIGTEALGNMGAASYNIAIGYQAAQTNDTAFNNIAIGYQSLNLNEVGARNVAIGWRSMYNTDEAHRNIAIGPSSLVNAYQGNNNIALGVSSSYSNTSGSDNVSIGYQALASSGGSSNNLAVGYRALYSNTTGFSNIAIGPSAMRLNTTGYINTAIGNESLEENTTGVFNVSIGHLAMTANTTGASNIAIGGWALNKNTTGGNNVAIGVNSLDGNTTGYYNTAIGEGTLAQNVSGSYNTAIGYQSLYQNSGNSADNNVGVGYQSLRSNVSGSSNIAIGRSALYSPQGSDYNIAVGYESMYNNKSGQNNVAVGYRTMRANHSGSFSVAIGYDALYSSVGASQNVAIGYQALRVNTTGTDNVGIGSSAMALNTTGIRNTAVGAAALNSNVSGDDNVSLGYWSLQANKSGSDNIAIGSNTLRSNVGANANIGIGNSNLYNNTTGVSNVSIGNQSLYFNTIGDYNVSIGPSAMNANRSGSDNIAIGESALSSNIGADDNVAIGRAALNVNTTGTRNFAIGRDALFSNISGSNNIAFGYQAAYDMVGATANIAIGRQSLYNTTTGNSNIAIGDGALFDNVEGSTNLAIGANTLANSTVGSTIGIGTAALQYNVTGVNNSAIGHQAMNQNVSGSNNIAFGYQSLFNSKGASYNIGIGNSALLSTTTGWSNIAIGTNALTDNTTGINNIAFGFQSLLENVSGDYNTAIGYETLYTNATGDNNFALGRRALYNNYDGTSNVALGYESMYDNIDGNYNLAIGYQSLYNSDGSNNNLALGHLSGQSHRTGSNNIFIGANSAENFESGSNNIFIGYQAGQSPINPKDDNLIIGDIISGNFASQSLHFNTTNGGFNITGSLYLATTPTEESTPDKFLVWDDTNKEVKYTTEAGGGGEFYQTQTWAVQGLVSSSQYIVPMFVGAYTGTQVSASECRYLTEAGGVTCSLERNGATLTGFGSMKAGTTAASTDPTDVGLTDDDKLQLIIDGVNDDAENLTFTLKLLVKT